MHQFSCAGRPTAMHLTPKFMHCLAVMHASLAQPSQLPQPNLFGAISPMIISPQFALSVFASKQFLADWVKIKRNTFGGIFLVNVALGVFTSFIFSILAHKRLEVGSKMITNFKFTPIQSQNCTEALLMFCRIADYPRFLLLCVHHPVSASVHMITEMSDFVCNPNH